MNEILQYNLASFDDRLGKAIANVVAANGDILKHSSLSFQLKKLVLEPFEQVSDMLYEGPIVVAVDGLDECVRHSTETSRAELLQLFASDSFRSFPFLRLVLASRSEEDIMSSFAGKAHIHTFPLDIMSSETQNDIEYFLNTKLSLISRSSAGFHDLCAQTNAAHELSIRASGLFIWASTAITFIESYPEERLLVILETSRQVNAQSALTVLYRTALDCIAKGTGDDDIKADVQIVLGLIMAANRISDQGPHMTTQVLQKLVWFVYGHDRRLDIPKLLQKLGGILQVPTLTPAGHQSRLQLHVSFEEFLTDSARCSETWFIDINDYTRKLATACIQCIIHHTSHGRLDTHSLEDFTYSSYHWIGHCLESNMREITSFQSVYDPLVKLLEKHLL